MKKIFFAFAFILLSLFGYAAEDGAHIQFADNIHDFGNISENGGKVTAEFSFTNVGNAPLVIVDAKASCGCTSPVYPKQPVAPGAKGKVVVSFNPKGQPSSFTKVITVFTNDPKNKRVKLRIKGKIKK